MRKLSFYATLCALLIACTNADIEELQAITYENGIPSRVVASLDSDTTRIELNEELNTVWTAGDAVSVFYNSTANNRFTFTGTTGQKSGTLVRDTAHTGAETIDGIVAIYPYDEDYTLDTTTETINVELPATQHYMKESYGLGDNIMAYMGNSDNFLFRSIAGWIRLELTGAQRVTSITLRGNNDEQLSGEATLDYKSLTLELTASDTASRATTIDCDEGVQLNLTTPTQFYFVVAPQTFSKGFSIEVTFDDGTSITKSTTKSVTIERNHIQPMRAFDTLFDYLDGDTMPLITTYPSPIYDDWSDDIIVLVNAKGTAMANYTGDMYAHTGLITSNSTSSSDWKYVKAGWSQNTTACKLVNRGNNIWQFTIKGGVRSFYGVSNASEEISDIALVFRSSNGSKEIKDNGSDIFIPIIKSDIYETQLISTEPRDIDESTTEDIVITLNTTATVMDGWSGDIYAHTGVLTSKSSSTSDWKYVKANWDVNTAACKLTNIGDNKWQLTLKGGPHAFYGVPASEIIESLAFVFRSADGSVELKDQGNDILIYTKNNLTRRPLGADYGVTISGSSATFVLYAPGKSKVHLLADFNSYTADSESLMQKDGNYFWKTVTGLTIGKEYGYQYLIDGSTRVGDPYAEKILDPWNDQYISSTTYPNLKSYPSGASDVVSVFEMVPERYNWSVPNFDRPAKNSLAIYELLFRDFTTEQSVKAAINKLDHLETLGINAIELMPIQEFDGNDSWGYNPCFYFAPDKYYGTKEDYKRFIDECHKRGIAVILDIVINHATGLFPYAKMWWDGYNNCTTDANPFFNRVARHPYNVYHDFNHEYAETRNYFKRMLKFWLEEYKVDGFRFDLAKGLTQKNSGTSESNVGTWSSYDSSRIAIIKDYADAIRSISSDAYIILEHFADWSEENELANYRDILLWNNQCEPYYESVMGWSGKSDFSGDVAWGRVSYFESHDEERAAYKTVTWGRDDIKSSWARISKQLQGAYCLHFLAPYPKMMWQFGELGYDISINANCYGDIYEGEDHRTDKKPVRWDYLNDTNRKALYNALSKIITWRTDHEAMYSGDPSSYTYNVGDDSFGGKTLIYSTSQGSVIAVANFSDSHVSFNLNVPVTGTWKNLITGATVTLGSTYNVSLAAGDYIVLVRD